MRIVIAAVLIAITAVDPADAQSARVSGTTTGAAGVRLYYEIIGSAPDTILFLHGTPSAMYSLTRDFDALARRFTLVFFDQRGGGRSQLVRTPDSLRWQDNIADIDALRANLGIGRMHLVGISWGSALAVLYASEHPDHIKRIVVFPMRVRNKTETPTAGEILAPSPDSAARARTAAILREWSTASDPRALCVEYWRLQEPSLFFDARRAGNMRENFCDEPPEVLRHTWEVSDAKVRSLGDYDLRPQLRSITAPTLVVKGVRTTMYHAWTEEWARSIPNAQLLWIDAAGTLPWVEQPDAVMPALRTFFGGSWPSGSNIVR